MFRFQYSKSIKLLEKIEQFEVEFNKFNQILEKKLDSGLSYKFAISTADEIRENNGVQQLKLGSQKARDS